MQYESILSSGKKVMAGLSFSKVGQTSMSRSQGKKPEVPQSPDARLS